MKHIKIIMLSCTLTTIVHSAILKHSPEKNDLNTILSKVLEKSPYPLAPPLEHIVDLVGQGANPNQILKKRTLLTDEKELKWNQSINNNTPGYSYLSKNINWVTALHEYQNEIIALDNKIKDYERQQYQDKKWLEEQKKKYPFESIDFSRQP